MHCCTRSFTLPPDAYDYKVIDGAAIVPTLPPKSAATFNDYYDDVFKPHIQYELRNNSRADIVWDVYLSDCLKQSTRE